MSGFVLHQGATVLCMHGGQAQPTVTSPRVSVGGQPVVTMPPPWTVAGCPFVPPAAGPCATAQWTSSATRVTSGGAPLLLKDSMAQCVPTGTGLNILVTQVRVSAA